MVPIEVPFTTTVTPGIGLPSANETFPDKAACCAFTNMVERKKRALINTNSLKRFFISQFLNYWFD
jgi:hypothetical protein